MAETPEQSNQAIMTLSKMKQFHSDGKYWDVQIRVDKEVFKCQRSLLAAHSKYFDTMFTYSNFEESNAKADQPIILHEMDATAFEEISNFIHTGDIRVKDSNVFQLLVMNDFLQLYSGLVKERCLEYLKSRSQENEPISCALDLLCFAESTGENMLIDTLRAHICRHLYRYYSKDAQLMEISSEILSALLKFSMGYILPIPGSSDTLLKIIYKWINYNREKRCQYRSYLMENIDFARISSNFSRSLIDGRYNVIDKVVNLPKDIKSLSELRMLALEMDTNITNSDAQFEVTTSFVLENIIQKVEDNAKFSSSFTISNLSWKIGFECNKEYFLKIVLLCDGTDLCSVWHCYARATFIIKSQKEGTEDFVANTGLRLFSSDKKACKWGFVLSPKWILLLDPRNGFIKDDGSITLVAHVHADVPFLKM